MLTAFDDAIANGVQVTSFSIGRNTSLPYTQDGIAIGSLHAVRRNIVVACSAGNSGTAPYTVTNTAPWIITVGASSIDRVFSSPVVLGNDIVYEGQSITPFQRGTYPLVYAASVEIPGTTTRLTNGLCLNGTLSPSLVRGKAVFCWRGDTFQALEVQRAGGIATVLGNAYDGIGVLGRPYMIPATVVLANETMDIFNYTQTDQTPSATFIPPRTLIGTRPAPFMAPFTSRGPNFIEPNILKPDITAPGLNILAAWSEASSPLQVPADHRVVKYQILSGTSMSCPHVAAVAALLKAIHPDWSSAAIRFALMTTGVWPESESFNDEGMEPVPASWKGICENGVAFNSSHCNRRRFFNLSLSVWPESESFNDEGMEPVPASWKGICENGVAFNSSHCNSCLQAEVIRKRLFCNLWLLVVYKLVYVVYLGEHNAEKTLEEIEDVYHSYLYSVKGSKEEAKACIIYSYKNVINGFSALLTPEEADAISEMDGVISVFHSHPTNSRLHTTRSWDFINLLEANWDATQANGDELLRKASYGKDVIVGVLDSGVWPESESFNDEGMEPVPASWKGICENGVAFNSSHCNRKLIGARYYLRSYEANYGPLDPRTDFRSPRDINGHGTHTSSTIGGRRVANAAALGGFGNGTALGGAPLVRLAIYKVCWPVPDQTPAEGNTCLDDDMIAAFDDAIADGVQVISVSIGGNTSRPYTRYGIAIGSLHALRRNIVVACSAGNLGPAPYTVANTAPWIITVGASSIDRVFSSPVVLGNGMVYEGQSITPFQRGTYPLVYAASVEIPGTTTRLTNGYIPSLFTSATKLCYYFLCTLNVLMIFSVTLFKLCRPGTLSPSLVRGKAVFCWRGDTFQALEVQRAGGIAAVLGNVVDGIGVSVRSYLIPATVVLTNETMSIFNYTQTAQTPLATLIPPRTLIGTRPAPFMAPFTSRGPNFIEPNILKPDITAPGLNILAAWSEASSPLNVPNDHRVVKYQILSGTSMSCPHVAAVAALLKAIHPDWSSAAIRSALMTTAKQTNNLGEPITDALGNSSTSFEYGAGHIQPSRAADPGLVYDASYNDYLLFLCSSSGNLLDPSFNCPEVVPSSSDFNYPSLAIANLEGISTVTRTVTNVGMGNSLYSVTIDAPPGYSIQISPATLYFSKQGEQHSFSITVEAENSARRNVFAFGWYTWSDGIHQVRSPVSVALA
ncbi:hypothetical protein BUALT_Bualt10G0131700 [Buddleja alternifolia]|uniref:Subtilisin n=1 Tax=Buddleja alternifolia TaxID=168488 RepID=A0AAV6X6K9_9LAMI|nr:hypothetical protein BUALT_Bualt10G0131700 [Buddleja alternifolia]